jgi:hypothetical protein
MTTGAIAWLVVGAISAVVFFGIAAVVTVLGVRDLRELLRDTTVRTRE